MPLKKILDLCPRFKAKILSKGMHGLNVEPEATTNGIVCNTTQLIDLPKMRDDKVAKINISII